MIELDVDFHVHGRYSGGTSDDMSVPHMASQAPLKGLDVVATGDALHGGWRKHLRESLTEEDGGLYSAGNSPARFIVETEVEDVRRVHHLILLPSLDAAEQLAEVLKRHSKNIDTDGRPNVSLNGAEIADRVLAAGGLIGPAHAFTPWTAIYKEYGSLIECYGDRLKDVGFLELGLSADSDSADRIEELSGLTYMSNSDCHSPWPHRLGREFNRILVKEPSFPEIRKAIFREGGRRFSLNAGLNPLEGKYHVSACSRCYLKFRWEDAMRLNRRCPECRGIIKKGVADRIDELAKSDRPVHPRHRPAYMHIIPLAEVIALATKTRTLTSQRVKGRWDSLVSRFQTEINVLVDEDIDEIVKADKEVGRIIGLFREGRMRYVAGGGGNYGHPTLTGEKDRYYRGGQKTLSEY
jgi:uncharacterized protein (TIGR00375 family)